MFQRLLLSARKTVASKPFIAISGITAGAGSAYAIGKWKIRGLELEHQTVISIRNESVNAANSQTKKVQKSIFEQGEQRIANNLKEDMPSGFVNTLLERGCHIRGSYVLSAITQDSKNQKWQPGDIDVFVPTTEVMWELHTLLANEGYETVPNSISNTFTFREKMQPPADNKKFKPIHLVLFNATNGFVPYDFKFLDLSYDKTGIVVGTNLSEVCNALFLRASTVTAHQFKGKERAAKYEKRGFNILPSPPKPVTQPREMQWTSYSALKVEGPCSGPAGCICDPHCSVPHW